MSIKNYINYSEILSEGMYRMQDDTGKKVRIRRLCNSKTGKMHIVLLGHGGYSGPIQGIERINGTISKIVKEGANALLLYRGS